MREDDMTGADQLEGDVTAEAGGGAGDQDSGHDGSVRRCAQMAAFTLGSRGRAYLVPLSLRLPVSP
ncbi:hypothetical protein GCM10023335_58860 [Streptomyces siamensis]|uniref:Uncharacterized protein n=1 Tax=Streptomyces siamensis TaxID=1274986 RepID=A0ABP9J9A5_9ACTN